MNSTQPTRGAVLLVSLGLLVAGCAGPSTSSGDAAEASGPSDAAPSGTSAPGQAVSLSLAIVPGLADAHVEALQDEVRAAGGAGLSLEMASPVDVQNTEDAEQQLVGAVADGTVDLAVVGARAFAELGAHDLDALVAPMTLDSVAAQQAVLATDLPGRMLAGLQPLGVTGLAVLPGPLRRPVTVDPVTDLDGFAGLTFYTWRGEVAALAVEALGATLVEGSAEERNVGIEDGSIRAFENTLAFMADNGAGWRTDTMTLDIGLWPSVAVVVANPEALDALDATHRDALTQALAATVSTAVDRLPDEQDLVEQACAAGASFVVAGDEARAEIEAALAPVLEQLRTDPLVAGYLDEIEALTDGVETSVPTVPEDCTAGTAADGDPAAGTGATTPLDGSYTISWSVEDLTEALGGDANPEAASVARANAGTVVVTFDRGRYDVVYEDGSSCPGTFVVDGDRVVATATERPSEWSCGDGLGEVTVDATWTLTGDTLTLTDWDLPQTPSIAWFMAAFVGDVPLERVP